MKRNTIIITTVSILVLGAVGFFVSKTKKRKASENSKINGIREETTVENARRTGNEAVKAAAEYRKRQQEEETRKAAEDAENVINSMF